MKISAIICEYNPFHYGHKFHIEKTRQNGADAIVAIMSGDVVQRGDVAITDKYKRAKIALQNGADIVAELPCPFSCAGAQSFARAGVFIAKALGADTLSFGSEYGDTEVLKKCIDAVDEKKLSEGLKSGLSYPKALSEAIEDKSLREIVSSPNNTLAIEYMRNLDESITPFTVKREGARHDSSDTAGHFASASLIREQMLKSCLDKSLLPYEADFSPSDLSYAQRGLLYTLSTFSQEYFLNLPECDRGLYKRIKSALTQSDSLSTLYDNAKTKCYTHARIRRVILYALLGVTKEDFKMQDNLPYIRILAMNDKGREVIKNAKATAPIVTSLSEAENLGENARRLYSLSQRANDLINAANAEFCGFKNEKTNKFIKED